MEDILKSLVTLGGFGFFNYKVLPVVLVKKS